MIRVVNGKVAKHVIDNKPGGRILKAQILMAERYGKGYTEMETDAQRETELNQSTSIKGSQDCPRIVARKRLLLLLLSSSSSSPSSSSSSSSSSP